MLSLGCQLGKWLVAALLVSLAVAVLLEPVVRRLQVRWVRSQVDLVDARAWIRCRSGVACANARVYSGFARCFANAIEAWVGRAVVEDDVAWVG